MNAFEHAVEAAKRRQTEDPGCGHYQIVECDSGFSAWPISRSLDANPGTRRVAVVFDDGEVGVLGGAQPAAASNKTGRRITSRRGRWEEAAQEARAAYDKLQPVLDEIEACFSTLRDIQQEYVEWHDNLPESLQGGDLGQKLEEIGNIEIPEDLEDLSEVTRALDEIEGADLPSGRNG